MSQPEGIAGPIAILGLPRSGTTWLGKLFDSHPDTLYRHEPDSGALDAVPVHVPPDAEGGARDALRAFLETLPDRRSPKVAGKLPLFPKRYLPAWRGALHRASVYAGKAASGWVALPVITPVHGGRSSPRLIWKSIESTGRAGLIAGLEPAGRIILLLRHPCAQIDSTLRGEASGRFTDDSATANDWDLLRLLLETPQARRRGLTLEALRALTPEERLAWRWLLFNEKAMEELSGHANARVVRYEDLCREPEATLRRLFDFAGLGWDPAVADFLASSTRSGDSGYYSVYRDPVLAAEGWRERMAEPVIQRIMAVVRGTEPGQLYAEAQAGRTARKAEG